MPQEKETTKASPRAKSKSGLLERLTPFLIVISIILAFMVGMLWEKVNYLSGGSKTANKAETQVEGTGQAVPKDGKLSEDQANKIPKVADNEHFLGSKDAKVKLIEYSDLECPFCKQFHPTVKKLESEYKGKIVVVYRHYPLDPIHPKADKEAEAVECAAELGGEDAFWKLTDKIFEVTPANNGLDHSLLPGMAAGVGVNQAAWKSCWDSGKYKDKVEEQFQGGVTAGVSGTPTSFVVNEKGEAWMIIGAQPYESVKAIIEEALKS